MHTPKDEGRKRKSAIEIRQQARARDDARAKERAIKRARGTLSIGEDHYPKSFRVPLKE